jgi:hypothetical protein
MSLDEALKNQSPNHVVLMGHYNSIVLKKLSSNEGSRAPQQVQPQMTRATKVLLSISLRNDALLMIEEWLQWLSSFHHPQVAGVEVEDVIRVPSGSTLLLLSMPVAIWARLRPHHAYIFVGFIKSSDVLKGKSFAAKTGVSQESKVPITKDPQVPHSELPTTTETTGSVRRRVPIHKKRRKSDTGDAHFC